MKRYLALIPVALLSAACHNFTNVDEACKDKVQGEKFANELDRDAIQRINCYRRLTGISQMGFEKSLQEATVAHVEYVMANDGITNGTWASDEEVGNPGFTGVTLEDRLEAQDFFTSLSGFGIWQFLWVDNFQGPDRVDFWFPDPWVRQAYLQPSVRMAGYSGAVSTDEIPGLEGEEFYFAYMTLLYDSPAPEGRDKPFIYPKDGQTDIDSLYIDGDPGSPVTPFGRAGFPITMIGSGALDVKTTRLVGPDGNVDTTFFEIGTSGGTAGLLRSSAFLLPNDELEPGPNTASARQWPLTSARSTSNPHSR